MKQLKTSMKELEDIFEEAITIHYLAEPLCSVDKQADTAAVRDFMEQKDYDVVGVRDKGSVVGYVHRDNLKNGYLNDFIQKIESPLSDTTSMFAAIKILKHKERIFVLIRGKITGIVTRGDLQKAPMRMFLFSIVTLIEMHMLRIVRLRFPDESWKNILSDNRLRRAQEIFNMRKKNNVEIDLADCLQFCDKKIILLSTVEFKKIFSILGLNGKHFLKDLEDLRNDLAHGCDIITTRRSQFIDLGLQAKNFLEKCESFPK